MLNRLASILVILGCSAAFAADENLVGKDLSAWKLKNEKASHWKVAADVKTNAEKPKEFVVAGEPGAAPIMVNDLKEKEHGCDIFTVKEFGDCEVHVELMVPKGSNSGVYLMGRYEVQVLDSFGKSAKNKPGKGDMGGVYNVKEPIADNYEPKAPGEWQTLDIVFQAPKFDPAGKKTANAKIVSVKLNGKEIQKDVDVAGPTGGQLSNKEVPQGPLMFQGDHGPVAFKVVTVKEAGK